MNKDYQVFYWTKSNRIEYLHHIFVRAQNAKEACKIARDVVKEKTGRHAFRPTTKAPSQEEMEYYRRSRGYVVD